MDKEHKKLMNAVIRSLRESLEFMGGDLTDRIAKAERRTLFALDDKLSKELRAVATRQAELFIALDRVEKAQQIVLDRLPEVDEMEGLRRRIRHLERALQGHLISHEDPFENFDPCEKIDDFDEREAPECT
jgi:hypothetical protein